MNTRRMQDFVVKGKEEDSKKTWKLAVRCEKMLVHQVSMKAKYPSDTCGMPIPTARSM